MVKFAYISGIIVTFAIGTYFTVRAIKQSSNYIKGKQEPYKNK